MCRYVTATVLLVFALAVPADGWQTTCGAWHAWARVYVGSRPMWLMAARPFVDEQTCDRFARHLQHVSGVVVACLRTI